MCIVKKKKVEAAAAANKLSDRKPVEVVVPPAVMDAKKGESPGVAAEAPAAPVVQKTPSAPKKEPEKETAAAGGAAEAAVDVKRQPRANWPGKNSQKDARSTNTAKNISLKNQESPALSATQLSSISKKVRESQPPTRSKESRSEGDPRQSDKSQVPEMQKIAERATDGARAPPVDPPRELRAKRVVEGQREPKDPAYATLDDDFPKFEKAILRGNSKETQPPSNNDKRKKESGEKTPKTAK